MLYVSVCRFLEGPEIWEGRLIALDMHTGEKKGQFIPEERESSINASPTLAKGVVYFATLGGGIYGIHSKTGIKIWTKKIGTYSNTSLVVADGMLYFGAMDYKIYGCGREDFNAVN